MIIQQRNYNTMPEQVQENKDNIKRLAENGLILNPKGDYVDNVQYNKNDFVYYQGAGYFAIIPNIGYPPNINSDKWQKVAEGVEGPRGPRGEAGMSIEGPRGPQGEPGIGIEGPAGPRGERGIGIRYITKTASEGLIDTYTIVYDDDTTSFFTVENGRKGETGSIGPQGVQGVQGVPGVGIQGPKGDKGDKGDNGSSFAIIGTVSNFGLLPDPSTVPNGTAYFVGTEPPRLVYSKDSITGTWINQGYLQGPQGEQGPAGIGEVGPQGIQGVQGLQGLPGVGIADIQDVGFVDMGNGTTANNINVTYTDMGSDEFIVYTKNGTSAGFGTPTATVNNSVGTPSVTVSASGPDTAKVFNFAFSNLKGEKGDTGSTGPAGSYAHLYIHNLTFTGSNNNPLTGGFTCKVITTSSNAFTYSSFINYLSANGFNSNSRLYEASGTINDATAVGPGVGEYGQESLNTNASMNGLYAENGNLYGVFTNWAWGFSSTISASRQFKNLGSYFTLASDIIINL